MKTAVCSSPPLPVLIHFAEPSRNEMPGFGRIEKTRVGGDVLFLYTSTLLDIEGESGQCRSRGRVACVVEVALW